MTFNRASLRKRWEQLVSMALVGAMLTGCAGDKKLTYIGNADLDYYKPDSLTIQYADVDEPTPDNVAFSQKPHMLGDRSRDEIWEMTLAEALHLALKNNKILRVRNDFLSPGNGVYVNPDNVMSVYDPAIRESGVLFGGRGVTSALSAFDTTFTTNLLYNSNNTIANNLVTSGGLSAGDTLNQDTGQFSAGLNKNFAYGANLAVTQNWNYTAGNSPSLFFKSSYAGNLGFQYTQPLWAGAGTEFTRIAGPLNTSLQGLSGVNQGVAIARINTDMTLVDFEVQVRNMLKDTEDLYWELYLAYRSYDSQVVARNSALRTWREVKAKADIGARGGGAADEAEAREQYFNTRAAVEDSLQNLYTFELQLRRLCGLAANDGRTIRPADEPSTAEFIPDWHVCLAEALTRREELQRQKWNIKSLELQLIAARNLANPQVNLVAGYQLNGFGNNLFGANQAGTGAAANDQSAYRTQFQGNQTGYTVGFQANVPIGLRNANSQVRNIELRLAKAKDVLAVQELEVSHELANSFQTLAWRHKTAQTNFNRRRAAEREVQAFEAEYRAGTKTLDLLLQAQSRLAAGEIAYYTSIIRYNQAITDTHYRKGTLLENDNVHLSEGMWTPEAYKDALRRAWARSYAFDVLDVDPVHTEPAAFSSDTIVGSAQLAGEQAHGQLNPGQPATDASGVEVPFPSEDKMGPAPASEPAPLPPATPPAVEGEPMARLERLRSIGEESTELPEETAAPSSPDE